MQRGFPSFVLVVPLPGGWCSLYAPPPPLTTTPARRRPLCKVPQALPRGRGENRAAMGPYIDASTKIEALGRYKTAEV